jgi:hypothetical protein
MDVIGAGFGRTGTLSLKVALEQLGFGPCMHMLPLLDDEPRATLFNKAAGGDRGSLHDALAGCHSTVDWPGAFFWRELVEDNPEAKVVLTLRDPEQWYASIEKTILAAAQQRSADAPAAGMEMIDSTVLEGTFDGHLADREYALRVFEEHTEEVRRVVPAGNLLEFEVQQGWEPLCDFLGRSVPERPFPRLNDTASFQQRLASRASAHG